MGGREDDGDRSSGDGEAKMKKKRSRSPSQEEDERATSSKANAHKTKEEARQSGSDGHERYVYTLALWEGSRVTQSRACPSLSSSPSA